MINALENSTKLGFDATRENVGQL